MFANVECKSAEIFGMVLAKLLNPFALVHIESKVRVSLQFHCLSAWTAHPITPSNVLTMARSLPKNRFLRFAF